MHGESSGSKGQIPFENQNRNLAALSEDKNGVFLNQKKLFLYIFVNILPVLDGFWTRGGGMVPRSS